MDSPPPSHEEDARVEELESSPPCASSTRVSWGARENLHAALAQLGQSPNQHGPAKQVVRSARTRGLDTASGRGLASLRGVATRFSRSRTRGPYVRFCEREGATLDQRSAPLLDFYGSCCTWPPYLYISMTTGRIIGLRLVCSQRNPDRTSRT